MTSNFKYLCFLLFGFINSGNDGEHWAAPVAGSEHCSDSVESVYSGNASAAPVIGCNYSVDASPVCCAYPVVYSKSSMFERIPYSKELINVIYYNHRLLGEEKIKISEWFLQLYLDLNPDANIILWVNKDSQPKLKINHSDLSRVFIFDRKELNNQMNDQLNEELKYDHEIVYKKSYESKKFGEMSEKFKDIGYKLSIAKVLFDENKCDQVAFVDSEVFPDMLRNMRSKIDEYGFVISADDAYEVSIDLEHISNAFLLLDREKSSNLLDFICRVFRNERLLGLISEKRAADDNDTDYRIYNINQIMYIHWLLQHNTISINVPISIIHDGVKIDVDSYQFKDERIVEFFDDIEVWNFNKSADLTLLMGELLKRNKLHVIEKFSLVFGDPLKLNLGLIYASHGTFQTIMPFVLHYLDKISQLETDTVGNRIRKCILEQIIPHVVEKEKNARYNILIEYKHELGTKFISNQNDFNLPDLINEEEKLMGLIDSLVSGQMNYHVTYGEVQKEKDERENILMHEAGERNEIKESMNSENN